MKKLGGSVLLGLVLAMGACGSDDVEPIAPPPPPPGDVDRTEVKPPTGEGPPAPTPPDPNVTGKPIEGVFVSSSKGHEDGDGAMARPLKTLEAAFKLAGERNLPVVACAEVYTESLTLLDGVTAYGFYDCQEAEWKRVPAHATIASPTTPAVNAEGLTRNARFEGFDIVPPPLPAPTPGTPAQSSVYASGTKVTPASHDHQGKAQPATGQTAIGGAAGDGVGANGTSGAPGALGANGAWSFTNAGFVLTPAKPGGIGSPGQGGGGGGSRPDWVKTCAQYQGNTCVLYNIIPTKQSYTGAGGAGGAGGCGGLPGTVGTGGGGSFGLVVIDSEIAIAKSRVAPGKGGRAGKGGSGTDGTPGRPGGNPATAGISGGAGGKGGAGGAAGLSGNGSAGPSIALLFHGARPVTTDVELVPGPGGDGVPVVTKGAQSLPAIVGDSKAEHTF